MVSEQSRSREERMATISMNTRVDNLESRVGSIQKVMEKIVQKMEKIIKQQAEMVRKLDNIPSSKGVDPDLNRLSPEEQIGSQIKDEDRSYQEVQPPFSISSSSKSSGREGYLDSIPKLNPKLDSNVNLEVVMDLESRISMEEEAIGEPQSMPISAPSLQSPNLISPFPSLFSPLRALRSKSRSCTTSMSIFMEKMETEFGSRLRFRKERVQETFETKLAIQSRPKPNLVFLIWPKSSILVLICLKSSTSSVSLTNSGDDSLGEDRQKLLPPPLPPPPLMSPPWPPPALRLVTLWEFIPPPPPFAPNFGDYEECVKLLSHKCVKNFYGKLVMRDVSGGITGESNQRGDRHVDSVVGIINPRMMKVEGINEVIMFLKDSGATDNMVMKELVSKMKLPTMVIRDYGNTWETGVPINIEEGISRDIRMYLHGVEVVRKFLSIVVRNPCFIVGVQCLQNQVATDRKTQFRRIKTRTKYVSMHVDEVERNSRNVQVVIGSWNGIVIKVARLQKSGSLLKKIPVILYIPNKQKSAEFWKLTCKKSQMIQPNGLWLGNAHPEPRPPPLPPPPHPSLLTGINVTLFYRNFDFFPP